MEILNEKGKIIKKLPKNKIYILLIPYKYNPTESFARSVKIVKWLRIFQKVGVFSPILHTHHYHISCLNNDKNFNEDYYKWDMELYNSMKGNASTIFTIDYEISKGCKIEIEWAEREKLPLYFINE